MPIYKSEDQAVRQHIDYEYDTALEGKYQVGGHALFLYRALKDVIPQNSAVLDIGCNSGAIGSLLMADKNVVCYGIDVTPEMVRRAALKGVFVRIGRAEHLPWEDNKFDATILMEILEHVYNPKVVFNEAVRVTRQGGIVTGSVPHPRGEAGAKGFRRHKYHARVFDKATLKELLKSGLRKIEIKSIYTDPDLTSLPNWFFWRGEK